MKRNLNPNLDSLFGFLILIPCFLIWKLNWLENSVLKNVFIYKNRKGKRLFFLRTI